MRVVKLGGSLLETGQIFDCLSHIAKSNQQTVVVCGGGEFANQVRQAQTRWCFDDVAAHEMAILAMQQVAILCQNKCPEFAICSSVTDITQNRFVIWSPDITELNNANIPATWDITSDSLAAWLAGKLNAEKLALVKSCDIDSTLSIRELTAQGIVDSKFNHFVANTKFAVNIMSATVFLTS